MDKQRIVVGVDAFAGVDEAVAWAARECVLRGTDLLLVHALDHADSEFVSTFEEPSERNRDEFAQRMLDENVSAVGSRYPALTIRTLLSHAAPTQALIDASSEAALLVLGSHGPAGLAESILGTPSHRVATQAHCPVAVVPAAPRSLSPATGGIVVGLAPTRAGRLAMHFALDEAGVRGCKVTAVGAGGGNTTGDLDRLEAKVAETYPGVAFAVVLADTEPARAVLDSARGADLIVLGCHHSDDKWSARLGSVPTAVLHRAACPVVMVGQLH